MLPSYLRGITLQQMDAFLTAARFENFSKAAKELFMTQSSVSRNVSAIETALGITLFSRHNGATKLTEAGNVLAEEWTELSSNLVESLKNAYSAQQGTEKRLRIGDFNTTDPEFYLLPILKMFAKEQPDVETIVDRSDPLSVLHGLRNRRYDVIFFSKSGTNLLEESGMKYIPVYEVPPCVVMSVEHPLFGKKNLTTEDLNGQLFVFMKDGDEYDPLWSCIQKMLAERGVFPKKVKFVSNPHSLALELKRGEHIAIMDSCFTPFSSKSLRYIALSDYENSFGFVAAYLPTNTNAYLKNFLKVCRIFGNKG